MPNTKYNETELRCDFFNGSRITLLSSENPDSIRGIYLDGVVCDEASQISRELIDEVIRPAIADRKGWMSLCSTPKGMNNIFYDGTEEDFKEVIKDIPRLLKEANNERGSLSEEAIYVGLITRLFSIYSFSFGSHYKEYDLTKFRKCKDYKGRDHN